LEYYFDIEEMKALYKDGDFNAMLDESTVEIWIKAMLDMMLLDKSNDIKNPVYGQFNDSMWDCYNGNFLSNWEGNLKAMCIALKSRTEQHAKDLAEMIKTSVN
jgi:hypothetical protein